MNNEMTTTDRKSRIRRGLPIEECGLIFYPIRMAYYEEFLECKNVLALRMTSLAKMNFEYLSMPFLSVLWAIEIDSLQATGKPVGMFERVLKLLYLSLRLGYDYQKAIQGIYCEQSNPRILSYIEVVQDKDGKSIKISPNDFTSLIRPLIATQNGIELPDESYSVQLVEAEENINNAEQGKLKFNINDLISSVAYLSHIEEENINDWTIVQFERRIKAIWRDKNFTLYKQSELSGMVSFKDGNPYPSWCFDKCDNLTNALISLDEMQDKYKGIGDVKQTIGQG